MLKSKVIKLEFEALEASSRESINQALAGVFEEHKQQGNTHSRGAAYAGAKKGVDELKTILMGFLEKNAQRSPGRRQWLVLNRLSREFIDKQKKLIINECIAQTGHQVGPQVEELLKRVYSDVEYFLTSSEEHQKHNRQKYINGRVMKVVGAVIAAIILVGLGYLLGKHF